MLPRTFSIYLSELLLLLFLHQLSRIPDILLEQSQKQKKGAHWQSHMFRSRMRCFGTARADNAGFRECACTLLWNLAKRRRPPLLTHIPKRGSRVLLPECFCHKVKIVSAAATETFIIHYSLFSKCSPPGTSEVFTHRSSWAWPEKEVLGERRVTELSLQCHALGHKRNGEGIPVKHRDDQGYVNTAHSRELYILVRITLWEENARLWSAICRNHCIIFPPSGVHIGAPLFQMPFQYFWLGKNFIFRVWRCTAELYIFNWFLGQCDSHLSFTI